jgi:hypothetical protein
MSMTELLERAVEFLRGLPPETQDAVARVLLQLTGDDPSIVWLTPGEEEALRASLLEAERGEFATDDEIRALWAKHGL